MPKIVTNGKKWPKIENNCTISEITKYGEKITKIGKNVERYKKMPKTSQKRRKMAKSSFFWLETT